MLCNIFTTANSLHGSFHIREVLVVILLQSIRLGNGFINLSVISVLVLQICNRIFDSLRHRINFALFSNVLVTDNSIHSGFHTREVLVVVLLQSICLSNSFVSLSVISVFVLQSFNRIFDSLRHLIHFGLLGNVLVTDNGINSGFHSGEIFVVILVQGFCIGNGFVNLSVVSVFVLQSFNRIFDSLCHRINFALFSNVLVTDNSIHGSFHIREVFVLFLLQSIRLGNSFVNLSVISVFVLQGSNRIFNCLCHCIYFALFSNVLVTDNSLDSGFHTREILILILVQGICLSNGFINLSIVRIPVLQCEVCSVSLSAVIGVGNDVLVIIYSQRVSAD